MTKLVSDTSAHMPHWIKLIWGHKNLIIFLIYKHTPICSWWKALMLAIAPYCLYLMPSFVISSMLPTYIHIHVWTGNFVPPDNMVFSFIRCFLTVKKFPFASPCFFHLCFYVISLLWRNLGFSCCYPLTHFFILYYTVWYFWIQPLKTY